MKRKVVQVRLDGVDSFFWQEERPKNLAGVSDAEVVADDLRANGFVCRVVDEGTDLPTTREAEGACWRKP